MSEPCRELVAWVILPRPGEPFDVQAVPRGANDQRPARACANPTALRSLEVSFATYFNAPG